MTWNIIKPSVLCQGLDGGLTLCAFLIEAFFVEYKMFFYLHPLYFSREYDWKQPVL